MHLVLSRYWVTYSAQIDNIEILRANFIFMNIAKTDKKLGAASKLLLKKKREQNRGKAKRKVFPTELVTDRHPCKNGWRV